MRKQEIIQINTKIDRLEVFSSVFANKLTISGIDMFSIEDENECIEALVSIFLLEIVEILDTTLLIFSEKYLLTFSQQIFVAWHISGLRYGFVSQTKQFEIEQGLFA